MDLTISEWLVSSFFPHAVVSFDWLQSLQCSLHRVWSTRPWWASQSACSVEPTGSRSQRCPGWRTGGRWQRGPTCGFSPTGPSGLPPRNAAMPASTPALPRTMPAGQVWTLGSPFTVSAQCSPIGHPGCCFRGYSKGDGISSGGKR